MLGMQVSFNIWDVLINLVFSYIATVGFALTVNIPHRVIYWSGICGCAGWMVYWLVTEASGGRMISNTLGAFAVGLVAVVLAKWKKCPVTLFSVPGLVPLVPGAPAYMVVRRLIDGKYINQPAYMVVRRLIDGKYIAAQQMMMRVAIVTVSIALGFLLSTLFQEAWNKYIKRLKLREKLKK